MYTHSLSPVSMYLSLSPLLGLAFHLLQCPFVVTTSPLKMGRSSSSVDHFDERRHLQQPQSEAMKPSKSPETVNSKQSGSINHFFLITEANKDLPDYSYPIGVLLFVFIFVATVIGTLICIILYHYCFIFESPNHLKNRFKLKQKTTMMSGNQSSQMTSSAAALSTSTAY